MQIDLKNSTFWKTMEYLFYLFFVTFPFINYSSFLYGGTSTRSLNLIIFASLIGLGFSVWLFFKKSSVGVIKSPLSVTPLVYLLSLTISGFVGLSMYTTFWSVATRMTGIWYVVSLGFFMWILSAVLQDEKKHHRLILIIILSTAVYSVLDLFGKDGLGILFKSSLNEAFTFGNTSFAAMYIFGAFLLSLYYLLQSEHKKWWMYLLPVVLIINPNILSKSVWFGDFSTVIGAAQATSYVVLLTPFALLGLWAVSKISDLRKRSLVSYSLFGIGVVTVAIASFSLLSPNGYLREAYLGKGSAARPLVWQISEKAIGQRPYFGWGGDNFERVFEQNYDNRLLQADYGNEAWFDRAHNVLIDQLVDNGIIGLIAYLLIYLVALWALLYSALHAITRRDRIFSSVLIVYFTLHFAELQTAFDTSISYPMVAFLYVSAAMLFYRAYSTQDKNLAFKLNQVSKYGLGGILFAFFAWSLWVGALPLLRAQIANGDIRRVGSSEKRIPLYATLFGSKVDQQAFLWRTATDFQRGISQDSSVLDDPKKVDSLKKELVIFEKGYRDYVANNPANFRAHLNLADVLIYQMLFQVNKLEEAQSVLDEAIKIVPQSPQPYWMKSVAYVYMRKFDLARTYAKKALDLNPQIEQSKLVSKYVEDSIKSFPDLDLFFFTQI
ncbi:MAG: hypothetical protein JWN18_664 [Parcubacteria group bacterium]|nr:hypothetical protein [Parcubacteria group bacterium]